MDQKAQYANRLVAFTEKSNSIPFWVERRYNEAYLVLRASNHAND